VSKKKPSIGVLLFGAGLLVTAIYKVILMLSTISSVKTGHYDYLFGYLPEGRFHARYIISWADKILELISAIGILCLNDVGRRIAILTWFLIVCGVSVKHPYVAFQNHVLALNQLGVINLEWLKAHGIPSENFIWWCVIGARLQDGLFGLFLIYFFTRPHVKKQFQP
jgi:hypothetical protein